MKIKVVEAAAHGSAIVTTEAGLQGLDFLRGAVGVAGDAESFAAQIVSLLRTPELRQAREEAVLAAIRKRLSPAVCYEPVYQALFGGKS